MDFGPLNYAVLAVYLAAMVAIGIRFAGRQKTTEDYFLAGRNMPWLPVAMSMFASLTSAITFMGLPARAYAENLSLLVVCIVSPLLVPVLVLVLYPAYRRAGVTTSYEFIGRRFGRPGRTAVSALFLLARLGWMGTVIYAPALALSVATGIPRGLAIVLMGAMATLYTALGGLSAVLWTDVVQYIILVGGAIWTAVTLVTASPDGVPGILAAARAGGHLHIVNWRLSLTEISGLAVAVSFFLQMLQDYGTDQVTVQRILAVRKNSGVSKVAVFNALTDVGMIALLSFIGLGLFAFYTRHPGLPERIGADSVLPYYIATCLPAGVSGLVISAIFAAAMSSMDSGINSLATVIQNDFIRPWGAKLRDERHDVAVARWMTVGLGLLSTLMAFYIARMEHIIDAFATFMGYFNAPVLALFVLGFVAPGARFGAWAVSVPIAIVTTMLLKHSVGIHWVYYFPLAFAVSFVVAWVLSACLPARATD